MSCLGVVSKNLQKTNNNQKLPAKKPSKKNKAKTKEQQ